MSTVRNPRLSKTRFGAGLQCLKRLYLDCYDWDLRDPISASQQARFDAGTAVGELARERFPGGCLIAERYDEHSQALVSTSEAITDQLVPAIYEAAFAFDDIRIRADILARNSDSTFDLVEVKSSTGVNPEHIPDAAIQLHVIEGSGLSVRKVFLLHIDSSYVYESGPYDLGRLFHLEDITERARDYLSATVPDSLVDMWEALDQHESPLIETGSHCKKPYICPFYGHCHQDQPDHAVEQLPRVGRRLLGELKGSGIRDIRDIPPDAQGLSAVQLRVRDSVSSGMPYVGSGLAAALSEVAYPLHFLDFETRYPALPSYAGTRPYQQVPFQWSLHVLDSQGSLDHDSFLHAGGGDPREAFSASLIEAVGPVGTILVYTGFERARIGELADAYPRYSDQLLSLADRFLDLHKVVRDHYYHPQFHGSYSIKSVLPALAPELGYEDLGIQDGSMAAVAFARAVDSATDDAERLRIRGELLDYCRRDTEGMVRIFQVLSSL